jgi:hypothetical protein
LNLIKFIFRLIVVFLPAILLLAWVELGLNNIDSVYKLKPKLLESQAADIEVLILGSSNAYFDYNPDYFSCKGFNFAINAQSPYYDLKIAEKYINQMPKVRLVILPAIFYTLGTNLAETSNSWRTFFYSVYMGLPIETSNLDFHEKLKRNIDAKNFSKIALFGDNTYGYIRSKFSEKVDIFIPEENGWYDSKDIPGPDFYKPLGRDAATGHSLSTNNHFVDMNLQYWSTLIEFLQKKGIAVAIVRAPEDYSYFSNLDKKKVDYMNNGLNELSRKYSIDFLDYSANSNFHLDDFTVLPDHMNPKGSKKFSGMVNRDVIKKKPVRWPGPSGCWRACPAVAARPSRRASRPRSPSPTPCAARGRRRWWC